MVQLPKQYMPKEVEGKWRVRWQEMGIYRWDPARDRHETFVVANGERFTPRRPRVQLHPPGSDRAPSPHGWKSVK